MSAAPLVESVTPLLFPGEFEGDFLSLDPFMTESQESEYSNSFSSPQEPTHQKVMDCIKQKDLSPPTKTSSSSPSKVKARVMAKYSPLGPRSPIAHAKTDQAKGLLSKAAAKAVVICRERVIAGKTTLSTARTLPKTTTSSPKSPLATFSQARNQKNFATTQTKQSPVKNEKSLHNIETRKEFSKSIEERKFREKEREQGSSGQQDQQQQQKDQKKKQNQERIETRRTDNDTSKRKLSLPPPETESFYLMFELEKLELASESQSFAESKNEIEALDLETTETHKKMLKELNEAIKKEKTANTWGVVAQVLSWLGAVTTCITGIALIATGVGVVAGALLIAGSVITVASQIMQLTRGWEKLKKILPGDNEEEKQAVISWMQISVAVLCMVLAGTGIIFGGFSAFGEAMNAAMQLMGGTVTAGGGVVSIVVGLYEFLYRDHLSDAKIYEATITDLKHKREDLMEKVDDAPERLEDIFEFLAKILGFRDEINAAYQAAWR